MIRLLTLLAAMLTFSVQAASEFVTEHQLPSSAKWQIEANALCRVAESTQHYLNNGSNYDPDTIHAGKVFTGLNITIERVQQTLAFICQIAQEDRQAQRPSRLANAEFIAQQFELLRWKPDMPAVKKQASNKSLLRKLPEEQLLITRYYLHKAKASLVKTVEYRYALYGLPFDEQLLSLDQAEQQRDSLTRYRFGKQDVLKGSLDGLAPPLIWLQREDLEAALMQGTIVVDTGQSELIFNVHRNNAIGYKRTVDPYEQQRYWYFKQVPQILGYGKDANEKILIEPRVTVAGDLKHLGLGKLLLLRREEDKQLTYRMAVLADTGGAFENNLFQLDWLSGAYAGRAKYQQENRHISDYADVWLLLKK